MVPRIRRHGLAVVLAVAAAVAAAHAQTPRTKWVTTWATATYGRPQNPPPPAPPGPPPFMPSDCRPVQPATPPATPPPGVTFGPQPFIHFTNQTLRQIVRTSVGGSRARVVVSNEHGTAPLTIGAAHLALRDKDDAIRAGGKPLTFSGRSTITIPAGAIALSDPVPLAVSALSDLAIDLYLPGTTNTPAPITMHGTALQTSYISETGNYAGATGFPRVGVTRNWFLLSRVEVESADVAGVVATVGDSITDGTASTPDANNRWPDVLARRLSTGTAPMAIANAGISANRLLSEGGYNTGINVLARFDEHVLNQPGLTHVIVMEGINDIGQARQNPSPTAGDLIAAHQQLIDRAHARGVKIFGATLTPFWGANYYSDIGEAKRQALNEWIRTSRAYDGVIDFDKAARDPADPRKFLAAYDSCDHLHPSDAGYKAMGEAIDLTLFRR